MDRFSIEPFRKSTVFWHGSFFLSFIFSLSFFQLRKTEIIINCNLCTILVPGFQIHFFHADIHSISQLFFFLNRPLSLLRLLRLSIFISRWRRSFCILASCVNKVCMLPSLGKRKKKHARCWLVVHQSNILIEKPGKVWPWVWTLDTSALDWTFFF